MRKILATLLCAALLVSVTACSSTLTTGTNVENSTTAPATKEYKVGETWTVDGQWELTVTGVTETSDRNKYSEKDPAAVYIIDFTQKNTGYEDESGIMDGLFFSLEDSVIDSTGQMGYSYPGEITEYLQETPVGASCKGQACIGVDNAGLPIKVNVSKYDGNGVEQKATFVIE